MSDPAASPELLATVRVGPEDARDCVLWLHGLGASGHDFEPIVPALGLPEVRFVFPHAPSRPVTINMGFVMPAWYDILSMDHHDASRESLSDIRESQAQIEALIADERARGAQRIVLAGFSQGAAMSLFAGLRHEGELEGIMVLSGYEVASTLRAERKDSHRTTPFFFGHGRHDSMVPMTLSLIHI